MNAIEELEKEVNIEANARSMEVFMLLLDKLERHVAQASIADCLRVYVSLKLARHHLKKRYYSNWGWGKEMSYEQFSSQMERLNESLQKARRNYYVARSK